MEEVELIEDATAQLYQLSLDAVDLVVNSKRSEELFSLLQIPKVFRQSIRQSWKRADQPLYGRFDFGLHNGQLKLFELNFDTPTSLYEAAILQWFWLQDHKDQGTLPSDADQFNSIHETLVDGFRNVGCAIGTLHLASLVDAREDEDTVRYLQSCATAADIETRFLFMHELGYDKVGRLIDSEGDVITQLFKLYPWEYLIQEENLVAKGGGKHVLTTLIQANKTRFFEPPWKLLLSNKAMLQILFELAPECPFLLEACLDNNSEQASRLRKRAHARKPVFGREGGSVSLTFPHDSARNESNPTEFGREGFVLQEYFQLPKFEGFHLLLGSWVIDGKPCGMGMRADTSAITTNRAIFVPHYIEN